MATNDTEVERQNWHWRNTMRPVQFFKLDARAAIPFLILIFYARPITFFLCALITGVFYRLERKGLTFPAAMRAFRVWLIGQNRPGWISSRRRRYREFR